MRSIARYVLVSVLVALFTAPPSAAQQGTLVGTVTTEAGLVIQSAQIDVLGTAQSSSVLSDQQGRYRLSLPPGEYDLVVTSVGSRQQRVEDVVVTAGQTTTLDIVLATRAEELNAIQVTASRGIEERETETVATVHTVSSLEITERPTQSPVDHIRTAPGVDVITHGLQATNVVVRGFNNIFSGSLHMLTDHRLAGVPSLRVNLMHFIPTTDQDIDRMEVVLGPGSALYGPNTANGVVHILTKSPIDSEGTTVTLGGGERSLFQGSFRSAWSFNDEFGIKVSGQYLRGDEWPYVDPTEEAARQQAADPTTRPICIQDKILRGLTAAEADEVCDRVGVRDFDTERWGGEVRADWRFASDGSLIATYGRTSGTGIELTGLGAGQTDDWIYEFYQARVNKGRLFAQAYLNTSDAGGTYLLQSGMPLVDRSRLFVGQVQHGMSLADDRQEFTYGFDYFGTNPRTAGTINGLYEGDDRIDEWGVYLQSRTVLTEQLDLILAGRMDDHSLLEDKVWSPRAAIVYSPVDDHSIRFSYNRAFSTPSSLNYFLDISAGFAPSPLGDIGFSARAFGTGPDGWTLQPGGTIRMRSPHNMNGSVLTDPLDPSLLWPAAVQILEAQAAAAGTPLPPGTAAFLTANPPAPGAVSWMLLDPQTSTFEPLASADLGSAPPIQESYTETFEIGWTGLIDNRLKVSLDAYRMKKNDFVSPLLVESPLFTMNEEDVAAHLTPLVGAAQAAQLAVGLREVPLGVVSADGVGSVQSADLILTYRNVGDVVLYGGDLAFQWFATDDWSVTGAYSYISSDFFPIENSDPIALNAPRHKGSVGLAYRNVRAGFTGGARLRFHDEFPAESATFTGTICVTGEPLGLTDEECVDSAALVDVNFAYRVPTTEATLQLAVTNVFDTAYRSFVGVPEIGRMAVLSVRYDLF